MKITIGDQGQSVAYWQSLESFRLSLKVGRSFGLDRTTDEHLGTPIIRALRTIIETLGGMIASPHIRFYAEVC